MQIIMQEIPERFITVLREVFIVRLMGEGIVTQGQLCFTKDSAERLSRTLNRLNPGTATVLGPFTVQGE